MSEIFTILTGSNTKEEFYVNLSNVNFIKESGEGSLVKFINGEVLYVLESPSEIFSESCQPYRDNDNLPDVNDGEDYSRSKKGIN